MVHSQKCNEVGFTKR